MKSGLLKLTKKGIYCPKADIYIDPSSGVESAVITHAHSDHARRGSKSYLAHWLSVPILKQRLGKINAEGIEYAEPVTINGVKISLHPAGHIPGSAQVRLEYKGEVAVVSGDYKLEDDRLTTPFEPVKCNLFISESTFGLPVYKWKPQKEIFNDINDWWKRNRDSGKVSILCGYSLGKSQRVVYNVDRSIGKIFSHNAIKSVNDIFINSGLKLPDTQLLTKDTSLSELEGSLVIAPSITGNPALERLKSYSLAFASGWMSLRNARKRRAFDIGFPLSDHADWGDLNTAIKETGAETVYVTHGYTKQFTRWLRENGLDAYELNTGYTAEKNEEDFMNGSLTGEED